MILNRVTDVTRFIRHGRICLGLEKTSGLTLTAANRNRSPIWSHNTRESTGHLHSWSAYGNDQKDNYISLGFNGERLDPISRSYHLGNGYRTYNPVLRRFNSPDSLSPFGVGGINPYAYCAGDPINHTDPTGHISWQGIVGIVSGIIGLVLTGGTAAISIAAAGSLAAAWGAASTTAIVTGTLGVAADITGIASGATEDVNPNASSVLGWVSMATGIAGMAAGITQTAKNIKSVPKKQIIMSQISSPFDLRYNSNKLYRNWGLYNLKEELIDQKMAKLPVKRIDNPNELKQFAERAKLNYRSPDDSLKFVITRERELIVGLFIENSEHYVTHPAIMEAMGFSSKIGVLTAGRINNVREIDNLTYVFASNWSGHFKPSDESINHLRAKFFSWGNTVLNYNHVKF